MGSIYGGLSTIFLYSVLMYIFGHGVIDLFIGKNDITTSKVITNNYLPDENEVIVNKYAFLP